ncbi:hypothetical protein TEHD86_0709 [Tetragenococcus halophilus subsp. halophilus]|uniref:Uncharacterized protein n=1 Tax=Tetragenococcus halophilus (strain DSM 20338 / JCM 20259 / NCIMB 9735 / NBRC 12172) TaxID=945021 RepID=A0AAN1SHA2_TETHN|nr:hypothetical protein C7K42_02895 [Tetragenococcus halophilus subsp. halophilus DSM 20339]BAK94882.1 hypothetical protein TEH_15550 [Tetragenococcus halophilus NBRC 12172]GBD59754.1 hypothetical protein TEHN0098T_1750 [Tetragenococcus halophilus subsp. halophilus]GMG64110.1 hypothetical protein TEHAL1_15840 [Tetragenococcus halophilus]GBD60790.1 hypothetical protein TEH11_0473 [Tetragenococcus halophilus subsp. halophilus]
MVLLYFMKKMKEAKFVKNKIFLHIMKITDFIVFIYKNFEKESGIKLKFYFIYFENAFVNVIFIDVI